MFGFARKEKKLTQKLNDELGHKEPKADLRRRGILREMTEEIQEPHADPALVAEWLTAARPHLHAVGAIVYEPAFDLFYHAAKKYPNAIKTHVYLLISDLTRLDPDSRLAQKYWEFLETFHEIFVAVPHSLMNGIPLFAVRLTDERVRARICATALLRAALDVLPPDPTGQKYPHFTEPVLKSVGDLLADKMYSGHWYGLQVCEALARRGAVAASLFPVVLAFLKDSHEELITRRQALKVIDAFRKSGGVPEAFDLSVVEAKKNLLPSLCREFDAERGISPEGRIDAAEEALPLIKDVAAVFAPFIVPPYDEHGLISASRRVPDMLQSRYAEEREVGIKMAGILLHAGAASQKMARPLFKILARDASRDLRRLADEALAGARAPCRLSDRQKRARQTLRRVALTQEA